LLGSVFENGEIAEEIHFWGLIVIKVHFLREDSQSPSALDYPPSFYLWRKHCKCPGIGGEEL
jgi:hypothetical protein